MEDEDNNNDAHTPQLEEASSKNESLIKILYTIGMFISISNSGIPRTINAGRIVPSRKHTRAYPRSPEGAYDTG